MKTCKLEQSIPLPPEIEKVLILLDKSGFFDDGLLVGSWTFPFYRELFHIEYFLRTDDVDFALGSEEINKPGGADLKEAFIKEGISPFMDYLTGLQKFLTGTFGIEFLIHRKGGREEIVTVDKYNIHAQPLPFLDLLFISPVRIIMPEFSVKVPSPEALFLHKLIIAQRRKKESKRLKDLEQCSILVPRLNRKELTHLAGSLHLSSTTVRNIRKSCKAIEFLPDFL